MTSSVIYHYTRILYRLIHSFVNIHSKICINIQPLGRSGNQQTVSGS